ncbi:MAG: hypothetical protein GF308_06880, partial [Candidatus Heimdallarchaeota archaeon]|nr:hypothetical protein [Candidatus Heimdallarchaeota archaeon]
MKFNKTVFVITLLLTVVISSFCVSQVFGYTLTPGDDPNDEGGPGTGGSVSWTLKRTWKYYMDFGLEGPGDARVKYIVKEYRSNYGYWKIVYEVKLDYLYEISPSQEFLVHRFNPHTGVWYRAWLTDDNVVTEENYNGESGLYHQY